MRSSAEREGIELAKEFATREILFDEIDKEDFILFWTTERKQKTERKRAEKLYRVLEKVLKGKPINEESLRQGFHETTNKKDYVNAARVLLDYLKVRKLMPRERVIEILEQPFLTPIQSQREVVGLTDEEIKQAYEWINEKWDEDTVMLYKLLVFSGLRLEHAIKMLETFDKRRLEVKGKVARYYTGDIGTKIKISHYAFMPVKFAKSLRKLEQKLSESTWENRINPKRWKGNRPEWQESRVNAKNIREWFQNFCKRHGVDYAYREYFMGHTPKGMGAQRYDFLEEHSWEEYKKIVDKFPIPA